MFQRALEVVDSCRGDEAVQTLVLGCDRREHVVHFCVVAHVDPHVFQAAAVLVFGFVFGGDEVWVWCFQAVEAVDWFMLDCAIEIHETMETYPLHRLQSALLPLTGPVLGRHR